MLRQVISSKKVLAISGFALVGAGIWLVHRKVHKSKECPLTQLFERVVIAQGLEAVYNLTNGYFKSDKYEENNMDFEDYDYENYDYDYLTHLLGDFDEEGESWYE